MNESEELQHIHEMVDDWVATLTRERQKISQRLKVCKVPPDNMLKQHKKLSMDLIKLGKCKAVLPFPKPEDEQDDAWISLSDFISWVSRPDNRTSLNEELSMVNAAIEKVRRDYYGIHEYEDGSTDRIVLSTESENEQH